MKRATRPVVLAAITALCAGMLLAGTASANEVLCQPGFEDAAATGCWTFSSDPADRAAVTANRPRTGGYSAELCGIDPCDAHFEQNYLVPREVTSATLTFWFTAFGNDPTCGDNLFAAVASSTDAIRTDHICPGEGGNGAWSQRTLDATSFLQAHAGESVRIAFIAANTNEQDATSWFVDDVSFDVESSSPTTHPRSITLSLRRHLVAKGALTSDGYGPCVDGVEVKIQKRSAGKWRTIKSTTTNDLGTYRVRLRDRAGKYRVKAPSFGPVAEHTCEGVRSVVRVHRH